MNKGLSYRTGILKDRLRYDSRIHVLIITLLFLVTRILFLYTTAGRGGDADEAVFGMMAQKIAALDEFPLVCWEAHYAGAFVSYMAAIIFYFFGSGFVQLRIAMLIITLPSVVLFYFIYRKLFDSQRAFICIILLLFSPYLVFILMISAYGGYGESFLGIALIILISWKIKEQSTEKVSCGSLCFLLGMICGFFTYIQFFVIPACLAFAFPVLWIHGESRTKSFCYFSLGGLIGLSPLIIYNMMNAGGTLTRGAARVLLIGRDDISADIITMVGNVLLEKGAYLTNWLSNAPLMLGRYAMPSVFGQTLQVVAGLALIVLFSAYIVSSLFNSRRKVSGDFYHRQFAIYLLIFMLFQWVASLKADRHFMPLFFVIPIAIFSLAERYITLRRASVIIVVVLALLNVFGWNQEFRTSLFDPHNIVKYMEKKHIREFYSSYWTGYPIMFLGEGRLVGSPMLLPYHEPFSDRRPKYTDQVIHAEDAAFVFGIGEEQLKAQFIFFLNNHQISFQTAQVGGTTIHFQFSTPVGTRISKEKRSNVFFLK